MVFLVDFITPPLHSLSRFHISALPKHPSGAKKIKDCYLESEKDKNTLKIGFQRHAGRNFPGYSTVDREAKNRVPDFIQ